jgi:hypothetical protein
MKPISAGLQLNHPRPAAPVAPAAGPRIFEQQQNFFVTISFAGKMIQKK